MAQLELAVLHLFSAPKIGLRRHMYSDQKPAKMPDSQKSMFQYSTFDKAQFRNMASREANIFKWGILRWQHLKTSSFQGPNFQLHSVFMNPVCL